MAMETKEKTIGDHKYIFKDSITMKDRIDILHVNNEFEGKDDMGSKMDMICKIFTIVCVSINSKKMTKEQLLDHVYNMPGMEEFDQISECITEIAISIQESEKKKDEYRHNRITVMKMGFGEIDREMAGIGVCKYMGGRSWDDYLKTPLSVVCKIQAKMEAEYQLAEKSKPTY